ncbi:MAG: hypothetical protein WED11_13305, partial [Natronospirillum sp.]
MECSNRIAVEAFRVPPFITVVTELILPWVVFIQPANGGAEPENATVVFKNADHQIVTQGAVNTGALGVIEEAPAV